MATNLPNLNFVAVVLDVTGTVGQVPNAAAWSRDLVGFPSTAQGGGGGTADPVGPQRWPLKL
jgi:hypothetical protein